jgi:hypothetical protein
MFTGLGTQAAKREGVRKERTCMVLVEVRKERENLAVGSVQFIKPLSTADAQPPLTEHLTQLLTEHLPHPLTEHLPHPPD